MSGILIFRGKKYSYYFSHVINLPPSPSLITKHQNDCMTKKKIVQSFWSTNITFLLYLSSFLF